MKRSLATLCGSVLGLLVLATAGAQAGPVVPDSISITENWAPSGFTAPTSGNSFANEVRVYAQTGNQSDHYVSFSNESAVTLDVPTQSSALPPLDILATNLRVATSATKASPDVVDTDFALNLLLTDNATLKTANMQYTGHLHATFYVNNGSFYTSMTITPNWDKTTAQSTPLNGNTVFVQLDQITHASTGNSQNAGSIGGEMWAMIGDNPPPPPPTEGSPEPATLLLGFLGLSGLGAASARKWLAARAQNVA